MKFITACIVLYKNDINVVSKAINSFLKVHIDFKLYVVDNSPTDFLKAVQREKRVVYIHNPGNPGFGAGHNLGIENAIADGSSYHFVVNPDIYFSDDIITPMVDFMDKHPSTGMLMPQILNHDGSIQNLPKLLPSPLSIVLRKLRHPAGYYQKFIDKYELRFVNADVTYQAPVLSGCFTLLNLKAIEDIGRYDDTFFMYFEDWDLSRRMAEKYDTIYYPQVSVYHNYESGANKSINLFKIYLRSAFNYFNKWGWFFDGKRRILNQKTLTQFK